MADGIELIVDGRAFGGWTDASVSVGIDSLASSFTLELTLRDPGALDVATWPIKAGALCQIRIGGETVISGYLDRLESSLGAESHTISASGRSKAADLIDCSAVHSPASWSNKKLEAIATDLAAPFGLSVTAKADTGAPFKSFAVQQGESIFECIERMLKMRGLLAVSTPDGNVEIISPKPVGSAVTIREGEHIEALSGRHDVSQRFSKYLVKGQAAGDDDHNGKAVSQVKAEASDPGVARARTLIIIAEDQATTSSLQARAKWEATVRAAQSQGAEVTLPGWHDPNGKLIQCMSLWNLIAPSAWIDAQMMAASVTYTISDGGSRTVLSLVHPDAYSQMPVAPEAQASSIKGKHRA